VIIENQLFTHQSEIERWFVTQWQLTPPPVYGSMDIRNAGFKLSPVDMNLFPAGFNNLSTALEPFVATAARSAILQWVPQAKRILLIPENHTRNVFYWKNIQTLLDILKKADFEIQLGELNQKIEHFIPDVILLNNDLSSGIPESLQKAQQPILPPPELGWNQRLKSKHFQLYADVADEFSQLIHLDPWQITPLFRQCGEVNFMKREGEECLIYHVEQLLAAIQKKYDEYQIAHKPFIIIKADAGTYGMGIMTVRSIEEVRTLNRKERTRMAKTKGGTPVNQVIIQEGIYTIDVWGKEQEVAEPVIYLWGKEVVGGFYRIHKDRGFDENLNSPGMYFEPFPWQTMEPPPQAYAYHVIARLSMLAAAREIHLVKG